MRLTLSLHDYLYQYMTNVVDEDTHCPVCYERVLQHSAVKDITHVTECYRQDLLYRVLEAHVIEHDQLPDGATLQVLVNHVNRRVDQQMINCAELLENVTSCPAH